MKNNIFHKAIFLGIVGTAAIFCHRCAKDTTSIPDNNPPIVVEPPITYKFDLTKLRSAMPSELFTSKAAIYVDETGNKHKINLTYSTETRLTKINEITYEKETFRVIFANDSIGITTVLIGTADAQTQSTSGFYTVTILNVLDIAYSLDIQFDNDKNQFLPSVFGGKLVAQETIFGKTFQQILVPKEVNNGTDIALRFSPSVGVVSLIDKKKKMYVFDRFE